MNVGFLRSPRVEYVGKRLVALDLDAKRKLWSNTTVATIKEVFCKTFDYSLNDTTKDYEFGERDGVIQGPRYYKGTERKMTEFPSSEPVPVVEPFHQAHRPLRLSIRTPGLLDTLVFNDDPNAAYDLHADCLEVEPKGFGLNFRDVLIAMGQIDGRYMGF